MAGDRALIMLRSMIYVICGAFAIAAVAALTAPATAADAAPAVTVPPAAAAALNDQNTLVPVAKDGVVITQSNEADYDFGTLSSGTPIQHDFVLHNNSNSESAVIDRIQAACGCTTALFDAGNGSTDKIVQPGADATIHVSIDPKFLSGGHQDKVVWVYVNGETTPVTLHVTGVIVPAVSVAPSVIDFGIVQAGATPAMPLTLTIDKSAYPNGVPSPTTSSADITISLVGETPAPGAPNSVVRTYKVAVTGTASLGMLSTTINVPNPGNSGATTVFVHGTVVGELTCSPSAVGFGAVTHGSTATQQVLLTGTTEQALKGLTVTCGSPDLKATILKPAPSTTSGAHPSAILQVTFTPKDAGAMQSTVRVTTRKGETLELPAWAYVN